MINQVIFEGVVKGLPIHQDDETINFELKGSGATITVNCCNEWIEYTERIRPCQELRVFGRLCNKYGGLSIVAEHIETDKITKP